MKLLRITAHRLSFQSLQTNIKLGTPCVPYDLECPLMWLHKHRGPCQLVAHIPGSLSYLEHVVCIVFLSYNGLTISAEHSMDVPSKG
jgi:hypothetical protein